VLKRQGVAGPADAAGMPRPGRGKRHEQLMSGVQGMGSRGENAGNLAKRADNKEMEQKSKAPGARPTPGVPVTIVLTDVFTFSIVRHGFRVGREKKPSESR
jgi:hypothetical protein